MYNVINLLYTAGDIAGLIVFSLVIISVAVSSIFGAKWYIWGPKFKAKREVSKKERRIKKDGADFTKEEKHLLKQKDENLSSQELLAKHKAKSKKSKAVEILERRKKNAQEEKQNKKIEKIKEKELIKKSKEDEKITKAKQKKLNKK